MNIVFTAEPKIINRRIQRIISKRLNEVVERFPSVDDIYFYLGSESSGRMYYELKLKMREDSLYFKKYFRVLSKELYRGVLEIYSKLQDTEEKLKNGKKENIPDYKIFIVEDDPFYRKFLSSTIKSAFYTQVAEFTYPEVCYHQMVLKHPNLVVVDYNYIGDAFEGETKIGNGIKAIYKMKREFPETKFILISSDERVPEREGISEKSDISFVPKTPTAIGNLNLAIKQALPDIPTL